MKKFFLLATLVFCICTTNAQKISKVILTSTGTTESISIGLDDAIINLSESGNIINYGVEYFSEKYSNYSRIENYNGRIDMCTANDDKAFQGKVKYLGRTPITYFASYDVAELQGKVKSIGSLTFTYYMNYDDAAMKGKIKSIGSNNVVFYSSFENDVVKGKLKSIANTQLNYYSNFEDIALRGKVKNIGQVLFSYYPSYDRQMAGAMKTGNRTQNINGINFIVN
jgi:hypothetical protein